MKIWKNEILEHLFINLRFLQTAVANGGRVSVARFGGIWYVKYKAPNAHKFIEDDYDYSDEWRELEGDRRENAAL